MRKLKTSQDFIEDFVARIRHSLEDEFGPPESAQEKQHEQAQLEQIRWALGRLTLDALILMHMGLLHSYSLDCPCERYRVDIDGRTGDVEFIELPSSR